MASVLASDTDRKQLPIDHDNQIKQAVDESIRIPTDKIMDNGGLKVSIYNGGIILGLSIKSTYFIVYTQ